ncbi:DUF4157 domain-containing protein [Allocoleopsis sp.]|uniref:eCIS core domain-containing protein n=1 Tax=Allocoleopsis sp. TaxID=3088169 RepID=UPI002FD4FFF9
MSFHRIHQSSSQNTQTSQTTSQFAPRPFPIEQTQEESGMPPTQEEIENETFEHDKSEATRLQLKEKYDTIAPAEQERLGVLQAKMDSFWVQRRERTKTQPNLLEILTRKGKATPATATAAPIQPKLAIGQPNDQYEQEADRVAEQVISMASPAASNVQRQTEEEEQTEIQTKPLAETITPMVQRFEASEDEEPVQTKCEGCEGEEQIQRSADSVAQSQPNLESRLNNSKDGGSPLSDEVRSFMEPRFGFNFSQVRVHTDSEAVQMNRELNAQAFTHGSHIYFGEGKSPANDNLTAHEMTHVLQQTGGEQLQAKFFNLETHPITIANSQDGWVQRRYPNDPGEVFLMTLADSVLKLGASEVIEGKKTRKQLVNEAFWMAYPEMSGMQIGHVSDPEQKKIYEDAWKYIDKLYQDVYAPKKKTAKSESEETGSQEAESPLYGPWQDLNDVGTWYDPLDEYEKIIDYLMQPSFITKDARNLSEKDLQAGIEGLSLLVNSDKFDEYQKFEGNWRLSLLKQEQRWRSKYFKYRDFFGKKIFTPDYMAFLLSTTLQTEEDVADALFTLSEIIDHLDPNDDFDGLLDNAKENLEILDLELQKYESYAENQTLGVEVQFQPLPELPPRILLLAPYSDAAIAKELYGDDGKEISHSPEDQNIIEVDYKLLLPKWKSHFQLETNEADSEMQFELLPALSDDSPPSILLLDDYSDAIIAKELYGDDSRGITHSSEGPRIILYEYELLVPKWKRVLPIDQHEFVDEMQFELLPALSDDSPPSILLLAPYSDAAVAKELYGDDSRGITHSSEDSNIIFYDYELLLPKWKHIFPMDKQEFVDLCTESMGTVTQAYLRATRVMEQLAAAYSDAWENHKKTLEEQEVSNQLAEEILLEAALAFVPGGIGSKAAKMMKSINAGEFMVDGVKDMAKAGVRGVEGAVLPKGTSSMQPIGANPKTWRAKYADSVTAQSEEILKIINEWSSKANIRDPDFSMNFDPVNRTRQSLVVDGQFLGDVTVPVLDEWARKFELGFWKAWLERYAYTVEIEFISSGKAFIGTSHYRPKENQGEEIRKRINELGENGDLWLETYGGVALQRAEAEAHRLNRG